MKATRLCIALGAAQLARCAPVPRYSIGPEGEIVDSTHTVVVPPRVWLVEESRDGEGAASDSFDFPRPPRPELLPPLSRHRIPTAGKPALKFDVIHVPHAVHDESDIFEFIDNGVAGPPGSAIPFRQAWPSREHNDMLVVCLAAAFMVVVVVMETWKSVSSRRKGTIRLEVTASQPQISIRAMPDDQDGIQDEKRRV